MEVVFGVSERAGHLTTGHGGANQGWMALLTLIPETGDGLVVLTNGTNGRRLHGPIEQVWLESLAKPAGDAAESAGG